MHSVTCIKTMVRNFKRTDEETASIYNALTLRCQAAFLGDELPGKAASVNMSIQLII